MDRKLLDIVCCPVTRSSLELLPERELAALNELIGGETHQEPRGCGRRCAARGSARDAQRQAHLSRARRHPRAARGSSHAAPATRRRRRPKVVLKVPFRQLERHLTDRLAKVYLVAGDEPLLVDEALEHVRAAAMRAGLHEPRAAYGRPQLPLGRAARRRRQPVVVRDAQDRRDPPRDAEARR